MIDRDDGRDLLAAAREAAEPSEADRARVRAALTASLLVGGAAVSATTISKSGFFAGAFGKTLIGLATLAVIGGGWALLRRGAPLAQPRVVPVVVTEAPTPVPPEEAEPAAAVVEEPVLAPTPPPPVARKPRPAPPATDLASELESITRARASLRAGDAEAALAQLAEHGKRFPHAVLAEEATALEVRSLCAAGRGGEARALAKTFLARWPRSPQAPGVRATCPEPEQDPKEQP
jgi:hypothetical protein